MGLCSPYPHPHSLPTRGREARLAALFVQSQFHASVKQKGRSLRLPPPCGEGSRVGVRLGIERARELRKRMPAPEARLWNALRELRPDGFHFRRQVPLGPYYADFACHGRRLIIEVDGDTHGTTAALEHDARRDAFIAGQGYRVLRVTNDDVMRNLDGVMTAVLAALDQPPPSLPPHKGEGSLSGGSETTSI
ncbi:MAG: DUF559 domain-containing protein [Alphaproteobacteria bacterium]|nr:DUF559 domain-containing protein [Alphaproteobacteria bacterium]MBU1563412.1 DUF559 domain-containing protein [Alphaproteobacteria bacterium]MBU2301099.1 DUF559 domain-containing protein [Alphaproteobacteria bacterium]MBU2366879.1 DUF559 domain-containing protein [Alphaproteobacteria bacterium]